MATATGTKKAVVKPVPAKAKVAPAKAAVKDADVADNETPKPRGRQRDAARESELLEIILKHVTIEGEFPTHRTKGIGAAADAAGTDSIRARSIVDRYLAEKAGIVEPSAQAVYDARMSGLGWGVIDAMFGISRSESHRLADEIGGEGWHSKAKLFGQGGAERIRPEAEVKPKAERKAKGEPKEYTQRFEGDESKENVLAAIENKTVAIRVKVGETESVQKVKVTGAKLGTSAKLGRVVKFTDGKGNARTVTLAAFVK